MAAENMSAERTNGNGASEEGRSPILGAVSTAQEAAHATAEKVRSAAEVAADRLPAAVATAQDVSRDTARTLDELPDQALIMGTSFSLGLGVGLFLTGYNRLLVILALAPAAAMAATLLNRNGRPSVPVAPPRPGRSPLGA